MELKDATCKGGYTGQALIYGLVQTVKAAGITITLARHTHIEQANTPFEVAVEKDGVDVLVRNHHWLADARQTFTRQVRYHLGEQMNVMVRDGRFTCNREWTGKPYQVWVCRFCGEYYSDGITKAEAMMNAWEKKYGK